jgi:hypothetical protein
VDCFYLHPEVTTKQWNRTWEKNTGNEPRGQDDDGRQVPERHTFDDITDQTE